MRHSTLYTILFATVICVVCGVLVSSAAVTLKSRQEQNDTLDRQKKVLEAAGIIATGEEISAEAVAAHFERIESRIIDLRSGMPAEDIDAQTFDQRREQSDPASSFAAPANNAGIKRLPEHVRVFYVLDSAGDTEMVVLPIEGLGLWGTLYGYFALDADGTTVRGLTYYQHKETPGLGGEVDNPDWKALWPGRQIFDAQAKVAISVIKGVAGTVSEDPHHIDGLSGATITSRGVTNMLHFWMSEQGYGPFLDHFQAQQEAG
jgi:Na+-transporting NADH:ubiquinone oxidoreductase subunit C